MDSFISSLLIIYPIIVSILLTIILFHVKIESSLETKITINFGITQLTIPFIKSIWLIRSILILAIIGFAVFPLFRDYTSFFPKNYKMTVSYSNNDIIEALREFSPAEIKKYSVERNWKKDKEQICQNILQNIANKMKQKIDGKNIPMVVAEGNTYFSIKKMGFLLYDLEDSFGNLDHELQLQSGKVVTAFTRFKLERRERLNVNLCDIYINRGVIVEGRFKQYLYSGNELIYLFKVLAVTKVKFLPSISVGKTIYFYRKDNGMMVPIGVAVNSPMEREN